MEIVKAVLDYLKDAGRYAFPAWVTLTLGTWLFYYSQGTRLTATELRGAALIYFLVVVFASLGYELVKQSKRDGPTVVPNRRPKASKHGKRKKK